MMNVPLFFFAKGNCKVLFEHPPCAMVLLEMGRSVRVLVCQT
jgi:hypothetical protein